MRRLRNFGAALLACATLVLAFLTYMHTAYEWKPPAEWFNFVAAPKKPVAETTKFVKPDDVAPPASTSGAGTSATKVVASPKPSINPAERSSGAPASLPEKVAAKQQCEPYSPSQIFNVEMILFPYQWWTFCFVDRSTIMRAEVNATRGFVVDLPGAETVRLDVGDMKTIRFRFGIVTLGLKQYRGQKNDTGPDVDGYLFNFRFVPKA